MPFCQFFVNEFERKADLINTCKQGSRVMATSENFTNYLTELTVAITAAQDLGYVHTARALDRMAEAEKSSLRSSLQESKDSSRLFTHTLEDF